MRNNFINQNDRNPLHHQLSSAKIILKSNGKISLSKSTKAHSQRDTKTTEINTLKKQIFKLKCQLEEEKIENKKITILSNQIRKVKEKLIRKVSEKNAKDFEETNFKSSQKPKSQNSLKNRMEQKQASKEMTSNQELQTAKVSLLKDSTDQIFKNFSLVKSLSKKSQKIQPNQNAYKKIQENPKIMYLDEIQSLESRQIVQSRLNDKLLRMKSRQQSFLEEKTVEYPNLRDKFKNRLIFFNEFQEFDLNQNRQLWPETEKLSVTSCIKNKRNQQKVKLNQ